MDFLVIASGYNCASFVEDCYKSLTTQTYTSWKAVLISDGSRDLTNHNLSKISHPQIATSIFHTNMGAAKRRYDAIHKYADSQATIVVFLGLDDELLPNALEKIKEQYEDGMWMTYGNWVNQYGHGLPADFDLFFDEETHKNRDYRKVKYRSTAPNTFKKFLFDRIPEDDFKINGKWIDTTTESEVMFSCLEMCGEHRIGVITEPIYLYNQDLPGGTIKRLGSKYKYKIYGQIIARPKKDLY